MPLRREPLEGLLLGVWHGPLELLPVSSSAHAEVLPILLHWRVAAWPPSARKELEVALHAGTGAAMVVVLAADIEEWVSTATPARLTFLAAALAPAVIAGLVLEEAIEDRVRGFGTLAVGLVAGALALAAADRGHAGRQPAEVTWRDGLWLGGAQAAALVPGVSRSGATLAAARARGFDRVGASRLSWEVGLPVLLGAGALKTLRVWQRGSWPDRGHTLAAAAAGAFASTLLSTHCIGLERRSPLWPWAVWRLGLAASILAVRQNREL